MKKKWIIGAALLLVAAVACTIVLASDLFVSVESGDYTFRIRGGKGVIQSYSGDDAHLVIPESFTYEGETYQVAYVGKEAFFGCADLETVQIGENILYVEDGAFAGCSQLSRVEFLGDAPTMGQGVFDDTPSALKLLYAHDKNGYGEDFGYQAEAFYFVEYLDYISEGGSMPTDENRYALGDSVEVKDNEGLLVRTGYTLKGWTSNPAGEGVTVELGGVFQLTEETTKLYPLWEKNKYTITFQTQGGTSMEEVIVEYGERLETPDEPTKKGSLFVRWTTDEEGDESWTSEAVTQDMVIYAQWLVVPAAPSGVQATSGGYDRISIGWSRVSYADAYEVYRSSQAGGSYEKIGKTTSTSYVDKNRTYQQVYYYKIKSLASEGAVEAESGLSGYASAKAELVVPGSYSAVRKEPQGVTISWNATPGAGGYEVYQASSASGTFQLVQRTSSTSYTDTQAKWTEANYYKVRAYKTVNGSDLYSGFTAVKGFYRIGDQLADYMSVLSNRNSVSERAKVLRGGHLHNACVYFAAEALRRVGVPVRTSMATIDYLLPYLSSNGWVKSRDYTSLRKGDLCFTTDASGDPNGRPTHVFIFMGWVTPGDYSVAWICDNQSPYYDGQVLHTRYMLEAHDHNGEWKEAFSFFMYLR